MIVSDFIGLKGNWEKYLKVARNKFDVVGVMIKDPTDVVLPTDKHQIMMEDPISGKQQLIVPDDIRRQYEGYVREKNALIRNTFLRANCDFMELFTDKPFVGEIFKFFKKREMRR